LNHVHEAPENGRRVSNEGIDEDDGQESVGEGNTQDLRGSFHRLSDGLLFVGMNPNSSDSQGSSFESIESLRERKSEVLFFVSEVSEILNNDLGSLRGSPVDIKLKHVFELSLDVHNLYSTLFLQIHLDHGEVEVYCAHILLGNRSESGCAFLPHGVEVSQIASESHPVFLNFALLRTSIIDISVSIITFFILFIPFSISTY
jgi:hypothetical protein